MRVPCSMFGVRCFALLFALALLLASPVFADSKDDTLRPLGDETTEEAGNDEKAAPTTTAARKELEAEYRAELEKRLAQERKSYEASLTSLWLANAAVWALLIAFIVAQAFAARKRSAELARLKAQREDK